MSRRDEREIRRRLADLPAGEPPADLLARLREDLPPALAIGEEAAARRRPAALGRRWLLAASLALMTGAGAVGLRVMQRMPAPSTPAPRATAASPPLPEPAGAPDRQPAPAGPSVPARQLTRAGAEVGRSAPPLVPLLQAAVAPPAKKTLGDGVSASPASPASPVPEPLPPSPEPSPKPSDMSQRLDAEEIARRAPGELAAAGSAEAPAAVAPARPAPPAARAQAEPPAALMRRRQQEAASLAGGKAKLENKLEGQLEVRAEAKPDVGIDGLAARPAAGTAADASAARPLALWVPEVGELAADYDEDPVGTEGWTLAAGGMPPPPRVAGRSVSGPPAGARWVRFRVRAFGAALGPSALPDAARIEIDWNPHALADRRLLGGGRETGPVDVFAVPADQLRRGWTMVYEVRLAPAAGAGGERLATLRLRPTEAAGMPVRELDLAAAELAPTWQEAPVGLRLPCLAAAFAERRALGSRDGYADLLAAARDLAQTSPRGDRDRRRVASLVGRMARAERARPAGPP